MYYLKEVNVQQNNQHIVIIGTDTDIGKTYVGINLIKTIISLNKQVAALKPIACGTITINNKQINEDVYLLSQANNVIKEPKDINPICFNEAIAPHIAAAKYDYDLSVTKIKNSTQAIIEKYQYDHMIIEGCGGLLVPLNNSETFLDLVTSWQYPVILVVGIRLGCLNHALLSYQALLNKEVNILGWVANYIDPNMQESDSNISYLKHALKCPLIATNFYNEALEPTHDFCNIFH